MPLPKLDKKMPEAPSIRERAVADILNMDLVRPFGPEGTSATVTTNETSLQGDKPRTPRLPRNPLVTG